MSLKLPEVLILDGVCMNVYMNYVCLLSLIEPSSTKWPLLSRKYDLGKPSRSVIQHVTCIRVCMCLYYDLVFVLKGIHTWMCKQCFILRTWKCVYCVLHIVTYVTFVWHLCG